MPFPASSEDKTTSTKEPALRRSCRTPKPKKPYGDFEEGSATGAKRNVAAVDLKTLLNEDYEKKKQVFAEAHKLWETENDQSKEPILRHEMNEAFEAFIKARDQFKEAEKKA